MKKLSIINSLYKKRGILKSLFFNTFYRQVYIDDSFSYTFELKNLSKVDKRFLREVNEIIIKETEENYIKTWSIENEDESLVLFSTVKKEDINKKLELLKKARIKVDLFCPSEYLVGKYFASRFKNRNVQVDFILQDTIYTSLARQGTLLWVKKHKGKKFDDSQVFELSKNDLFDKEIIKKEDLEKKYLMTNKPKEIEKLFQKWVSSVND